IANPLEFLKSERLRRQQRRRPRSVSGLIELTPFLSQLPSQKFFDIFVTGCFKKGFWLAVRNCANLLPDLAVPGIRFRRISINRFDGEAMTYMGSREMEFQGACLSRTALASLPRRE
ncbi:hypothetical protein QWJ46_24625, partial [Rhizobium sp. CBN3]|uniref:hypothetical protein n=1 Tax=Rhizobium sp. CBN3 TaxID=3058045 RepID=UPI002673D0BA